MVSVLHVNLLLKPQWQLTRFKRIETIVLPTTTMAVTTINADGLLETSEAEDVNMSDILNPIDEENILTPEDEHGGSEDEIQNGQKSPSTVNERPAARAATSYFSRQKTTLLRKVGHEEVLVYYKVDYEKSPIFP